LFLARETGFITPSQTFDIAIIFERSSKKQPYFCLYNAVWVHLNVSIGGITPDRQKLLHSNQWTTAFVFTSRDGVYNPISNV